MIIKSLDDCRRMLVDCCSMNGTNLMLKIKERVDPGDILSGKTKFDPLRKITDSDYKHLKGMERKIKNIYKELGKDEFRREYTKNTGKTCLDTLVAELNLLSNQIKDYYEVIFFNNISLAKKYINPKLIDQIEMNYRSTGLLSQRRYLQDEFQEIQGLPLRFYDEADATLVNFYDAFSQIKDKDFNFTENIIKIGDEEIKIDDNNCGELEKVFIGRFDYFAKQIPDNPLVMLYRSKISRLPVRKVDLALVMLNLESDRYFNTTEFDKYSKMPVEKLLELLFKQIDKIKKKFLENIDNTPTHMVNILWALLESDGKI